MKNTQNKITVISGEVAVPNCYFPAGNEFGIADLDPELQADCVEHPVRAWGGKSAHWRASRAGSKVRLFHFYVDDAKFAALRTNPETPLKTIAPMLAEPNFTLDEAMPRWLVLYHTGIKRRIAKYWQQFGNRMILVDLNVPDRWADDNLIGVPSGWRAYATRASEWEMDALVARHEIACNRAGTRNLIFFVYGGGSKVQTYCRQNGLEYSPNERTSHAG